MKKDKELLLIGLREWVSLGDPKIKKIEAKIDINVDTCTSYLPKVTGNMLNCDFSDSIIF